MLSFIFIRLVEDFDVDSFNAAFLVSFIPFGSVMARLLFRKSMDRPGIKRLTAFQITLLFVSVSATLVPIASNYEWLTTYAFLYGFLEGYVVISLPLIVQDFSYLSLLFLVLLSYIGYTTHPTVMTCPAGIAIVTKRPLFIVPLFKSRPLSKRTEFVQLLESSDTTTTTKLYSQNHVVYNIFHLPQIA